MKPKLSAKIIPVTNKHRPSRKELWGNAKFKNCCYCEVQMPIAECTRDHLIPQRVGGSYVAACCLACNREKGCMLLIDYVIYLWKVLRSEADPKKIKRTEVKIRNSIKFLLLLYPNEYNFIFE